jgi:predicted amidohydrolase
MGPELSRVLAMKGARLLLNPTGRSALPRAREHLEQVTNARAHENLIAAASANRVGTSHGPPEWAGGSVIATVEFPGFPITLAKAGVGEEVITATIDFTTIGKWYDLLPWREWRTGPQRPITDLVARELAHVADATEAMSR